MPAFTLNFKNTEGQAISPVTLYWYDQGGNPIKLPNGEQFFTEVLGGTATSQSEFAQIFATAKAAGYQDTEVTANAGVNNIVMQKAGSVGAAVQTAKSKWPVILLVIVLIILAVWAYKKYYKKG